MKITLQAAFVAVLTATILLSGCNTTPRSGKLETPTFSTLEIPFGNGWATHTSSVQPPEILPTRGRNLRIWFYAPIGSSFSVSLRTPDGALTALPQNRGAPTPPEEGFFYMVNVNAALNPPLYTMQIRAPLSLTDPANFDVLIVNQSLRSDVTDSDPLVVRLAQRKVYTVSVTVNGSGHVTSNPSGIACGTSHSGRPMTDCSYTFGPGTVTLNPNSNDPTTTRFKEWSGNCPSGVQSCNLTLDGSAAVQATATFEARGSSTPTSSCPTAPLLRGLRWIDLPVCAHGVLDQHPGITLQCDANGYFCCEPGAPGANAPRCGGTGKIESAPSCGHRAPRGLLRQPGGCYEIDSTP